MEKGEEEEEEEEEEEGEEEEEVDIRTTLQFSVAMQQACTRQPSQLFLSSKQGGEGGVGGRGGGGGGGGGGEGGGGGGYQNYTAVFRSNAAGLYLSAKAIVRFQ